jgi:DNA-binding SARP family transcriptional activator/tetratricopeptide (TPR) repeat protein
MLLRTFGGLSIEPEPGDGPAPPFGPRRLALLAILAASNAHGISREKVLGILWPDVGEDQGRHTLSQTLYSIRRESGAAWVLGSSQLKLDPSLRSDVDDFLTALKSDDLERAATLYPGQFLEGFYLDKAPEFERWVDETRARLHSSALKAIAALARRSEAAGNLQHSSECRRRLAELEPLKSAYAADYLRALVAGGEHGAALRFAREYEARVRAELEIEPDPVIARIIAQIRAIPAPEIQPREDPRAPAKTEAVAAAKPVEAPRPRLRARRRVTTIASLIAASLVAVFVSQTGVVRWPTNGSVPVIAIGSITSRDTAEHSIVLRNLLATSLARLHGVRVLSNTRLQERRARGADSSPAALAEAAKRAGASDVVEGEIGMTPGGLALTLRRVSVSTGVVLHGYTLRATDIFALSDSATNAIAHDFRIDPPTDVLATVRTRSAVAYALYDNGMGALSGSDAPAAYDLFAAALGRDSSFAMAAARNWQMAVILERRDEAARLLPVITRLAAGAAERERLYIQSLVAFHSGHPLRDQQELIEQLTRRFPNDPDAQLLLGQILLNAGDFAGSVQAYNRAVFIDSSTSPGGAYCRMCGAIYMMVGTYMWWDSLAAAERSARRLNHLNYSGKRGSGDLIEVLLRQGRRAEAEEFLVGLRAARPGEPLDHSGNLNRDLIRWGRLGELEASLLASLRTAAPGTYGEMPWLLILTLRNQGRLDEAYALASQGIVPTIDVRLVDFHDPLSTAVIALEKGNAPEAAARYLEMVKAMRAPGANPGAPWARHTSWRMTLAAGALLAAGDTARARALADSISVIGPQSNWARDERLPHFIVGLLHQREGRHTQAVDEFRRAVFSLTDGYTRINIEMARSLVALGRNSEAIAVLRPALRGGVDGGNTYVTHTELRELMGQAFFAAGKRDSAAVYYRAVEQAWRGADARFAGRYAEAKARSAMDR